MSYCFPVTIKKVYLIPYSIEGDAGEDDIQVKIKYNPEAFQGKNPQFNDLNAEIKETVRHELEHLALLFNPLTKAGTS